MSEAEEEHVQRTVGESATIQVSTYAPLRETLFALRLSITTVLLAITFLWPVRTTLGPELWHLVAIFALYNGAIALLERTETELSIARWLPLLDLLVIGVLYYFDTEPAGVVFTLFVVALLSAAVTMTTPMATLYTCVTLVTVAVLAPLLPSWSTDHVALRLFGTRLVMLALVGIGAARLVQQVSRGYASAYAERMNAERLKELEQLRASFLTSISHDLNTPLTAINAGIGLLETSLAGQLRSDQERLLHNARRNGAQLRQLISDLLTYNSLKHQAFALSRERVDLREVVLDAVESVQALLQAKGQELTLDLAPHLPLLGDYQRLEQVVCNLLENAYKHTPPGTHITVTAVVRTMEIVLTVADDGPGIPPDASTRIFAPFQRLSTASSGSGLGLNIVQVTVELHGGRVWVSSVVGEGTAFHVVLPQRQEELAALDVRCS